MLTVLLPGAFIVVVIMLMLWWLGVRSHNFSYVDIGWAANFAVLALLYGTMGDGDVMRRVLICGMYGAAGTRLALHLARRIIGHEEEGRYQTLRREWGASGKLNLKFLLFFQGQAALNVALSLPMLFAVMNPASALHPLEVAAVILWLGAFAGESIADAQLARFKRNGTNAGRVCDVGLWSLSRHPNYFFEWLMWVAYALFALPSPYGWIAPAMPLLMLHFLINITGVKPTEAQAVRSKGDAYRRYQQSVSAFVPWFPKRGASR